MSNKSILSQLKGIDIGNIKLKDGRTIKRTLYDEAERLKRYIQEELDSYLGEEKYYQRTGNLQNSLCVDDFANIYISGNSLVIKLFFDDRGNHQSGDGVDYYGTSWEGNGETVNIAYLLDKGYEVKKDVWFKKIKNFGHREGGHFIEKGIARFNATNTLGIKIDKIYPDDYRV